MQCPYCGSTEHSDGEFCVRCGYRLKIPTAPVEESHAPGWRTAAPAAGNPPGGQEQAEDGRELTGLGETKDVVEPAPVLHTGQYLLMLALGLLPLLGIFYSLANAFGKGAGAERRSLAKAMLWLHGVGVCLGLVGLCLWVLGLAASLG